MKNKLLLGVGFFVVSGLAWAHHAATMYDQDKPITMKGVVTEFHFTNPHSAVLIEVKDASGNTTIWKAEGAPPARLVRAGWGTKTLKPGDEITVTCIPVKYSKIITPDKPSDRNRCLVRGLVGPGNVRIEGSE